MSTVTEKSFETPEAKAAEAERLVAEVKQLHADGVITDGDMATKAHEMMGEALRLKEEAKTARLAERNDKLAELLEQYESETGDNTKSVRDFKSGPIVPETTQVQSSGRHDPMQPLDVRLMLTEQSKGARYGTAGLVTKAINEGTTTQGGFLVVPQYLNDQFAFTRRQGNSLRRYGWLREFPVDNTSSVLLPRGSGAASVGIVAENATKPSADQSFTQITVTIYTFAGIQKMSNQFVMDSNPLASEIVSQELGTLLGNLEEQKIINGSGTGEPRGILNTTGINAVTSSTGANAQAITDNIIDGIQQVEATYFASPTGILMHPRRLAYLMKGKDTQNNYIFNPAGTFRAPGGLGGTAVLNDVEPAKAELLGVPIAVSANVPTTISANQDAVIIADWTQAFWFQRQDITLDVSSEAGTAFEQNQTWFRLEERAGFSAERYPSAFAVLTGTNLALV